MNFSKKQDWKKFQSNAQRCDELVFYPVDLMWWILWIKQCNGQKLVFQTSVQCSLHSKIQINVLQDWTDYTLFGQVWASLGKFKQVWASLNKFGQVWAISDKFKQICTSLDQFNRSISFCREEFTQPKLPSCPGILSVLAGCKLTTL